MEILSKILKELNYRSNEPFFFFHTMGKTEKKYNVMPFVSAENPAQVYLVMKIDNSDLAHVLKGDFLIALAKVFRKQAFHLSIMDKNTTLLFESECKEGEGVDHYSKMQIEDDPYYFKKYVFSSSIFEEKTAEEYLQNLEAGSKENISIVTAIQLYLSNTDIFLSYKQSASNQPIYSYFSELATKMPIFPIQIVAVDEIKSVTAFLSDELNADTLIDVDALEQLLESEIDFKEASVESILSFWKSITEN